MFELLGFAIVSAAGLALLGLLPYMLWAAGRYLLHCRPAPGPLRHRVAHILHPR